MKKIILTIIAIFSLSACDSDTIYINKTAMKITKASTPKELSQGLMFKTELCENCGMLFAFDESKVAMWMKNTLLPLDMIFADSNGQILCIEKNTTPMSEKIITCDYSVKYVLEVNANFCDKNNINIGDKIKL